MNSNSIRILIADDHALIREGLKTLLGFEEGLKVIGEAINGKETLSNVSALSPDVVFLDVNMPDMTGIEVVKKIKKIKPVVKIVMVTADGDRETLFQALDAGAEGYILKDSESADMIQAAKEVYAGETYIDKRLVRYLVTQFKERTATTENKLYELTDRELTVLRLISEGNTNKEIADQLFLSEKTVKNYATTIFKKLEVKDRVQATLYAIRNKIEEMV